LQRVRDEAFRAMRAIYIEPFASRLPLEFQKRSENYGEEKDVESEIFDTLKHVIIMGKGLEETL
jgi:hypothetical protein